MRPDDGSGRNGAIEGREHAALLLRETEQVDVRELPVADAAAVEERRVAEGNAVGPELVALAWSTSWLDGNRGRRQVTVVAADGDSA